MSGRSRAHPWFAGWPKDPLTLHGVMWADDPIEMDAPKQCEVCFGTGVNYWLVDRNEVIARAVCRTCDGSGARKAVKETP